MELETWVHNDKKVKDMLNQLLIPSILGYVDENFEKPKFSRSILQFVQKVNMNGLVIFTQ